MHAERLVQSGVALIQPELIKGPVETPDFSKDYQLTLRDAISVARAWSDRNITTPEAALKACLAARAFNVVLCPDGMFRYLSHTDAVYYILLQACSKPPSKVCVHIH